MAETERLDFKDPRTLFRLWYLLSGEDLLDEEPTKKEVKKP